MLQDTVFRINILRISNRNCLVNNCNTRQYTQQLLLPNVSTTERNSNKTLEENYYISRVWWYYTHGVHRQCVRYADRFPSRRT